MLVKTITLIYAEKNQKEADYAVERIEAQNERDGVYVLSESEPEPASQEQLEMAACNNVPIDED